MLKKEDFVYFGKLTKPHGTKGEIGINGDGIILGEDCDFVAVEIDGILVPFFLENCRGMNDDTIIVKFEHLDSAESVRFLTSAVASEMSYSSGLQREALFSIALVLFFFILLITASLNFFLKRGKEA